MEMGMKVSKEQKAYIASIRRMLDPDFDKHISIRHFMSIAADFDRARRRREKLNLQCIRGASVNYFEPEDAVIQKHRAFIDFIRPLEKAEIRLSWATEFKSHPALFRWDFIHTDAEAKAYARLIMAYRRLVGLPDSNYGGGRRHPKTSKSELKRRKQLYRILLRKVFPDLSAGDTPEIVCQRYGLKDHNLSAADFNEVYHPANEKSKELVSVSANRRKYPATANRR